MRLRYAAMVLLGLVLGIGVVGVWVGFMWSVDGNGGVGGTRTASPSSHGGDVDSNSPPSHEIRVPVKRNAGPLDNNGGGKGGGGGQEQEELSKQPPITTRKGPTNIKKMKGGRDGPDDSHMGMVPDPVDHMYHAWRQAGGEGEDGTDIDASHRCHNTQPDPNCSSLAAREWFRENMLLAIISGREGAFRVEVSQCTWLSHFAPENVFVFSDVVPGAGRNYTPHTWVPMVLPNGVEERDGDYVSEHIPKGYVQQVRAAGQGYSAAWIGAQFRFFQSLTHMAKISRSRSPHKKGTHSYKWFMIVDDDTMVNLDHLALRLQNSAFTSPKGLSTPWYLSKKGWGGAGHIYNTEAMIRMEKVIDECTEKYLIKGFRASDAALLKCSGMARLHAHKEDATMSHCPASHLGEGVMSSRTQATFHLKKDFYPPVLLVTWKLFLYYRASYCHDPHAAKLAVEFSTCAFGNCKRSGCTKEKNSQMRNRWAVISHNNTATTVPMWMYTNNNSQQQLGGM